MSLCTSAATAAPDRILVSAAEIQPPNDPNLPMIACDADTLTADGKPCGIRVSPFGHALAMAAVGSTDWIFLDVTSEAEWTMIPAENVLSATDPTPTKLAATALTAAQVPGLAFALELGCDALVLAPPTDATSSLWEAAAIARAQRGEHNETAPLGPIPAGMPQLSDAVVTSVEGGGIGDRVALDLTSLMRLGEGALVGSSAKELALVHGETIRGSLVPARPFRVNAGPVHSYVLMADLSTKYLEEVRAGDCLLIVDAEGGSRALTVGRCKVEPRPLLMVNFEGGQLFLQQAETVRLMVRQGAEYVAKSVTEVVEGDVLCVRRTEMGTHVGRRVRGKVLER